MLYFTKDQQVSRDELASRKPKWVNLCVDVCKSNEAKIHFRLPVLQMNMYILLRESEWENEITDLMNIQRSSTVSWL